ASDGPAPAAADPAAGAPTPTAEVEANGPEPEVATPTAPATAPPAPSEYCVQRLIAPLHALAGEPAQPEEKGSEQAAAGSAWIDRVAQAARQLSAALGGAERRQVRLRPMILTVPDPIESGLVYQFETMMQAVRLGFESPVPQLRAADMTRSARGYLRDHSFSPWDDREVGTEDRARSETCRSQLPGLTVFRNGDLKNPDVVLLLTVGETPTRGLHSAALTNALRVASRIAERWPEPPPPIKVIGPTFSGSAYSLRLAIQRFAREPGAPQRFEIVSGTASGAKVPELLRNPVASGEPSLTYHATTVPESAVDCAYLWFLKNRLGVDAEESDGHPELLEGVATLRESGTAFGAVALAADDNLMTCDLRAELTLSFPVHVSMLRDAYESAAREKPASDTRIARATTLGVSLEEDRIPHEDDADPSPKTRAAMDVMLSQVLGEISRHAITHVNIHATDIGDAIFLARKIRDVAPDVRVAFFEPDDILLHPQYRADLLGSLVVSPYPFLGTGDFAAYLHNDRVYQGFANAASQGVFNAVLAQRGLLAKDLFDYAFQLPDGADASIAPLYIWVSTIGRTGIVPMDVKPPIDCDHTIYDTVEDPRVSAFCEKSRERAEQAALLARLQQRKPPPPKADLEAQVKRVDALTKVRAAAWRSYDSVRGASLEIDANLELPRLWNFMYMAFVFAFVLDWARQDNAERRLAQDRMPPSFASGDDRAADRAVGRTKWWLYAAIRRFMFVLAFAYMDTVYWLTLAVCKSRSTNWLDNTLIAVIAVGSFGLAIWRFQRAVRQFTGDFRAFSRYVDQSIFPLSVAAWWLGLSQGRISSDGTTPAIMMRRGRRIFERLTLSAGLAEPVDREQAARVSFAQLRWVAVWSVIFAGVFTVLQVRTTVVVFDWMRLLTLDRQALPVLSLNVLRNVPLLNGVSPAAPALACMLCVYAWAAGRMTRILHAHALSRMSPADGESDLVSTPIRLLLYPGHNAAFPADEGYTQAERDLLNSIWRPITGRYYVSACLAIVFFPCVLFYMKRPSTLEGTAGSWMLGGGLALSAVLIGMTLIQLIQFRVRLERLLARTHAHELADAFGRLPEFARATLEDQLSRTVNGLLAWTACARQFSALIAKLPRGHFEPSDAAALHHRAKEVRRRMQQALALADASKSASGSAPKPPQDLEQTWLAECLIDSGSYLARLLELERERARQRHHATEAVQVEPLPIAVGQDNALATDDRPCLPPDELETPLALGNETQPLPPPGRLPTLYNSLPLTAATPDSRPAPRESGPIPTSASGEPPTSEWTTAAETHVATIATLLIQQHVRQFRYFMGTLVTTAILLLLAITSYPFQPYRLLLTCIWVVVGSVVAVGLWVYLQLSRNALLRRMAQVKATGFEFSTGFALRIMSWAILPLLSVTAAQYPDVANFLFQLILPFTRALK
ncbi:MAG: hypothetical protein ABW321_30330, partial [Polyangiales bacterium]